MSNNTRSKTPAPAPVAPASSSSSDRPFNTDEQQALVKTQIKSFVAHTNNQAVLNELESVLKSGRDNCGWKQTGRLFMEAFKEAPFAE